MKYVSAQWVTSPMGGPDTVKAIGDDGVTYFIPSEDCDIPPWPEYLAEGGTIDPVSSDSVVTKNITEVPNTLTGGPTIKEVFHGNE
jgi:hypothetical protein